MVRKWSYTFISEFDKKKIDSFVILAEAWKTDIDLNVDFRSLWRLYNGV